jgi:hypothetical protein
MQAHTTHPPIEHDPRHHATRTWILSAVVAGVFVTVGASWLGDKAPTDVYIDDRPTETVPAVPTAGDPRGETREAYLVRAGHRPPGTSTASAVVDRTLWQGPAPVTGGDPARGETDDSYFARTGHHLPAS